MRVQAHHLPGLTLRLRLDAEERVASTYQHLRTSAIEQTGSNMKRIRPIAVNTRSDARVARRLPIKVIGIGFFALLAASTLGVLGGGSSLAGASEIPAECGKYQEALARCYGKRAGASPPPWMRGVGTVDTEKLNRRCAAEATRLNDVCR